MATGTITAGYIASTEALYEPTLEAAIDFSTVEIWNVALNRLGYDAVTTTADTSARALAIADIWDRFRLNFISLHRWNGAKTTVELEVLDETPTGRWSYAYDLSSIGGLIRPLRLNGEENQGSSGVRWEEELNAARSRKHLLTNESECSLEVLVDIPRAARLGELLGPQVAWAMGICLAAEMAPRLARDPSEVEQIKREAKEALMDAKATDSMTGSAQYFSDTSLVDVRF